MLFCPKSENLSGTGIVIFIILGECTGPLTISLDGSTRIVDKDNQPIQLNGLGEVALQLGKSLNHNKVK